MFGVFPFGAPYFGQVNSQVSVIDPRVIEIVGSYQATLDIVGEYQTMLDVVGSPAPLIIDLIGGVE